MNARRPINIGYWIFAALAVLFLQNLWSQYRSFAPMPYSEFVAQLKAGNVEEIAISANVIQGTLKSPLPEDAGGRAGRMRFVTTRVDPELAHDLEQYNVRFAGVVESTWLRDLLGWIVPTLLLVAIWYFFIRRLQERGGLGAGLLSIGKSKAKVYVETDIKVTFADVAGVDEAKDELKEIVGFLKDPRRYGRLGARIPRGVLLVGPPGTGKTLLARAVAGEANVPFFSINGSEFVEMFVGLGAARVRDLFEEARKQAPAIIFIDELDALGRARTAFPVGGHDEKEQTLNQLLAELDGFDPKSGLVLLGATNRPEILDPALLRAGRFDRQVLVDRPDRLGRVQILKVHVKKVSIEADLDLDQIAALTPGFSGADLANLVNEAALHATRHERGGGSGRFRRRDRTHRRRSGKAQPAAQSEGTPRGRVSRNGARAGGDGAARRRSGAEDFDHSARRQCARLHDAAADRRPLPDDAHRTGEQARGAAGRTRGGDAGTRRMFDRCGRRPGQGERNRARHGHPLRHGRDARSARLRN